MGFFSGLVDTVKDAVGGVSDFLNPLQSFTPLINSGLSYYGAQQANEQNVELSKEMRDFNAGEAQKNRDFQERMSGSAYQRAVKDMMDAGLNPMLGYSQGGASTPGGSTASGSAAQVSDVFGPAVNSAAAAYRARSDLQMQKQQIANAEETQGQIASQTELNNANTLAAQAQAVKAKADANLSNATAAKTRSSTSETDFWSDLYKAGRSYTQPAASAASNRESGGLMDKLKDVMHKIYPPDPKTGRYHYDN